MLVRHKLQVGGKTIELSKPERAIAARIEKQIMNQHGDFLAQQFRIPKAVLNSVGTLVDITTLTTIIKSIAEQKFYEIPIADYMPVKVGEGAWSQFLMGYRSFDVAAPFEEGVLDTGADNTRLASVNSAVDTVTTPVFNWAKTIGWSIIDVYQASRAGNWDYITSLEKARVRNWQLGLQYVAFLGLPGRNGVGGTCLGLLNQSGIPYNTTVIPKNISTMSDTELNTFVRVVVEDYRKYSERTAYPNRFIMPESDFNGLASQMSVTFPLRTKISILEEAFQLITMQKDFKILPVAYADAERHADIPSIAGKNVYVLFRYEEEASVMNIPVDYTNTMQNTLNGFQFQSVGYGQFTGVTTYRPRQLRYYAHSQI